MKLKLLTLGICATLASIASADFDWGSDCSAGQGQFEQEIAERDAVKIGEIPANKANVVIDLASAEDVDLQLFDKATGKAIIAWPEGLISSDDAAKTSYHGVTYEYSGYNGIGGNLGNEFIRISGVTNRVLVLKAFGYAAGNAVVEYGFEPTDTCNEKGSGSFTQPMSKQEIVEIGEIARGKANVDIYLSSDSDLDVQLFAGDTVLVGWPDGKLSGPAKQTLEYKGMTIEWSGYEGQNGNFGDEYIKIRGQVTENLTMKAFAFEAGEAMITYEFGKGAGDLCGTRGTGSCLPGWLCKEGSQGDLAADKPGRCHGELWCESDLTAAKDCANAIHIAVPGKWTCKEFTCRWEPTGPDCPLLMPPHPSGCPAGWQTTTDERGCTKFYCPKPGAAEGEMCGGFAGISCQDGLTCHITESFPDAAGVCRDYSVNQGGECATDADCEEGLLCSNFGIGDPVVGTNSAPLALCEPDWMLGEFSSSEVLTIDAGASAETSVNVQGLASVAMGAFVTIEVDMGYNGASEDDLTFEIIPGETGYDTNFRTSLVDPSKIERQDSVLTITDLPVNYPGDDAVNGTWTLRITNANVDGNSARLRAFGLKVSSRWD